MSPAANINDNNNNGNNNVSLYHFMQNGLDKNMFVTLKAAISKDFLIVKRDIAGNSLSLCHALLEFIA